MKKLVFLTLLCLVLASCAPTTPTLLPQATSSPSTTSPLPTAQPGPTTVPGTTPTSPSQNQSSGVPNFDHIVLIVLENRDYSNVIGNQDMPYLNDLATKNVLLSNYFAVSHPSLPNYIALVSGSTQNITSDCLNCFVNQPNLADEIEASGHTWKAYMESMPSPCFIGDASPYAQKHNPFLYFNSIRLNITRCDKSIFPMTQLDTDLAANSLPNFSYIMPNLCNSGHDCSAATSDAWLKGVVDKLQGSPALGKNNLIIVTFDEGDSNNTSSCCGLGKGGGQVATVLISPLAKPGFTDGTAYSHYSLLKTILAAWNLPGLGKTDKATVQPITAPFDSSSGGPSATPTSSTGTKGQAASDTSGCSTSAPSPAIYSVKVCFSNLSNSVKLMGDNYVTATVEVTGSPVKVQNVVFYLDGDYLLTTFTSPYTFLLPSARWTDGSHLLSVQATLKDNFTTQMAALPVQFNNGVSSIPENTNTFQPSTGTTPAAGQPFIVAAAGDGAGGGVNESNVVDLISSINPNLLLYLGDVYQEGSLAEFYNWYGTASTLFGQFRSITNPTIGNHEYLTGDASAYFDYWNNIPDYYSYNAGGWHFVSLNSNGSKVPLGVNSDQYVWLQKDLQNNHLPCTIVYYHHPLFNIGPEGPTTELTDIWKLMADYKVSIVLNGHDHDYQRWVPLDGTGQPSPNGITEFVVGSAGHGLQSFSQTDPRVAYSNNTNPAAFGSLMLQLNRDGANFSYLSTDRTILDSGVIPCSGAAADTQAPTPVTGLSGTIMGDSHVDLTWSPATDNSGVAGYAIYRNGQNIATVAAQPTEYSDLTVTPSVNYSYYVVAFDPSGHHSLASRTVKINIPGVASSMTFSPVADTYVSQSNPASNYGKSPFLRISSDPDMHAYIRFNVSGLGNQPIARARLLLYVNNSSKSGFNISEVPAGQWNELDLKFPDAPPVGSVLATSGEFLGGSWVTIDLSQYITAEGTYNFVITGIGARSVSLASRESGLNAPQLIIDFQ